METSQTIRNPSIFIKYTKILNLILLDHKLKSQDGTIFLDSIERDQEIPPEPNSSLSSTRKSFDFNKNSTPSP